MRRTGDRPPHFSCWNNAIAEPLADLTTNEGEHVCQTDRKTILIVEDEALIRMISADILSDAGFKVLEAATADEAISVLETADYVELVFTDIRMPGRMDGLELARFVHSRWPDVRLLVTSGHTVLAEEEVPDDGRFLSKPYELSRLLAEIRAIIGPASTDPD